MSNQTDEQFLGVRGRVLLVFQDFWIQWKHHPKAQGHGIGPWGPAVSVIARELGVSRQRVYRACPELVARRRIPSAY